MLFKTTPFVLHAENKDLKPGQFPTGFKPIPHNKSFVAFVVFCTLLVLTLLAVGLYGQFLEARRSSQVLESQYLLMFAFYGSLIVFAMTVMGGMAYIMGQRASLEEDNQNVVLKGTIVKIYRVSETDDLVIDYCFTSPRRRSLRGRDKAHRPDMANTVPPPIGTPVSVLYTNSAKHEIM